MSGVCAPPGGHVLPLYSPHHSPAGGPHSRLFRHLLPPAVPLLDRSGLPAARQGCLSRLSPPRRGHVFAPPLLPVRQRVGSRRLAPPLPDPSPGAQPGRRVVDPGHLLASPPDRPGGLGLP